MAILDTGGKKPSTPTIGTASHSGSVLTISVPFTAPTYAGKGTISSYTVTSSGGHTASGASSPISVGGLTSGTSYTFTVRAITDTGVTSDSSSASNAVTALTTPANVTGLTTSRPSSGNIGVSWNAVSADNAGRGGAASVTYSVYYGTTSSPVTLHTTTSGTSTTISLTAGTSYWFKVVTNNSSFSSAGTTTATSTLCLATPANATNVAITNTNGTSDSANSAVSNTGRFTVTWTAASGGGETANYYVYYGTTTSATTYWTATSGTSATITGLTTGTSYWAKIYTYNSLFTASGTVSSNSVIPVMQPNQITTGFNAFAGNAEIAIGLDAGSRLTTASHYGGFLGTGVGYKIYTSTDNANFTLRINANYTLIIGEPWDALNNATACTITGLTNGTAYYVTINSYNNFYERSGTYAGGGATFTPVVPPYFPPFFPPFFPPYFPPFFPPFFPPYFPPFFPPFFPPYFPPFFPPFFPPQFK